MKSDLRGLLATLLCLALSACGGGDSQVNVEGVWAGTLRTGQGSVAMHAVIQQDGAALFFDQQGLLFVLPPFTGQDSLSQTAGTFPPYGYAFDGTLGTVPSVPAQLGGNVSSQAISGTFSFLDEITNAWVDHGFQVSRYRPFSGTPSVVPGTWSGQFLGSSAVGFQVDAAGKISGFDGFGCALGGSVALVSSAEDLFKVEITTTGASSFCGHDLTGLAYESDADDLGIWGRAKGVYYYLAASDAYLGMVAELKVQ